MEPFEWLVLGIGLAVGSLFGSRGKGLVRSAAKGYLTVEEKARQMTANMREDFQDAVEEARYEREQEIAMREVGANGEADGDMVDEYIIVEEVEVAPPPRKTRSANGTGARGTAKKTAARKTPARAQSGAATSDVTAASTEAPAPA